MAQSKCHLKDMIEPFYQRYGRRITIQTASRYVRDEVDRQSKMRDTSAVHLHKVATTLLQRNNEIRLAVIQAAVAKGALVTAVQALDGSARNIMEHARLHGAISPVVTKPDEVEDKTPALKQDNFLAAQIEKNDEYQSMVQAALDVMAEDAAGGA